MAIWQRRPPEGLNVHSDRGSQYASEPYRRLLKGHGFVGSPNQYELDVRNERKVA